MNVPSKPAGAPPTAQRAIQIRNFRPADKNTLKGFFSVIVPPGMTINDCKVHQKGSSRWISLPSREYTDAQGERKWAPVVEFVSQAIANRFRDRVLEALDRHLAAAPGPAEEGFDL